MIKYKSIYIYTKPCKRCVKLNFDAMETIAETYRNKQRQAETGSDRQKYAKTGSDRQRQAERGSDRQRQNGQ